MTTGLTPKQQKKAAAAIQKGLDRMVQKGMLVVQGSNEKGEPLYHATRKGIPLMVKQGMLTGEQAQKLITALDEHEQKVARGGGGA